MREMLNSEICFVSGGTASFSPEQIREFALQVSNGDEDFANWAVSEWDNFLFS